MTTKGARGSRLSSTLSGIAGEYMVAAELSRRGYIASITLRNTRGVDILAANGDATKSVGIQVKTSQGHGADWMLLNKAENEDTAANLFYVFVSLNNLDQPAFHVVPQSVVARFVREGHAEWLRTPGRRGQAHRDTKLRRFRDPTNEFKDRWDILGLD